MLKITYVYSLFLMPQAFHDETIKQWSNWHVSHHTDSLDIIGGVSTYMIKVKWSNQLLLKIPFLRAMCADKIS